jgi:hypothetical protein
MSDPEIARRCPSCGASIREVALFCPQCGDAQPSPKSEQTQADAAAPIPGTTSKDTASLNDAEVAAQKSMADTVAIERTDVAPKSAAGAGVRGAVGTQLHRATTLARGVEGDVIHRVQKVRQISNVVWDEAGDDPGLRFVLVAAMVFVLFLVIILLNKFIV